MKNSWVLPEYKEIVLPLFTLILDPIMNVKGGSTILHAPKIPKNYSLVIYIIEKLKKKKSARKIKSTIASLTATPAIQSCQFHSSDCFNFSYLTILSVP